MFVSCLIHHKISRISQFRHGAIYTELLRLALEHVGLLSFVSNLDCVPRNNIYH
jgi:hypothetical protein